MTYARQSRLDKGKRILIFGLSGAFLIFVFVMALFISGDKQEGILGQNDITSKVQNEVKVIRATRSIQAGEMADVVKFEVVEVPKELVPGGIVPSIAQLKNKRVANQLAEGEFLLQRDLVDSVEWYEDEDRLIEHTFQDGAIPVTVEVGSVVDIKLFRPQRIDDIVVAKAVVIGKADKTLSFYMDKLEQEYLKEANTEGFIFLVQYLDKSQAASTITYRPVYPEKNSLSSVEGKQSFADSNMKKK